MDLSPQQLAFKEAYTDPKSPTFGNAKQSALKAGYSEHYSNNITRSGNDWVSEIVRDQERKQKAEKRLDEFLDMDVEDPAKMRIVTDVAKFVLKGMAKEKYSERYEHTGPDGKELPTPILNIIDKYEDKN